MCGIVCIDMHGVTYANNLLKNPATKRLAGKKQLISKSQCDAWNCTHRSVGPIGKIESLKISTAPRPF